MFSAATLGYQVIMSPLYCSIDMKKLHPSTLWDIIE